jgi:Uma2 family endonuclease
MSIAPLRELVDRHTMLFPLTVEQYHGMLEAGIIADGEPYELLDGCLVRKDRSSAGADPMTVGYEHAWVVKQLAELNARFKRLGRHIQTQQPVTLPLHSEPEPDAAVVRGIAADYRGRHPGPAEVLCIIEVADASLPRDRGLKLRVYAQSGVPCYVILNLPDRVVEVYTEPLTEAGRYGRAITLTPRERVAFPAPRGRQLTVPVRRLLPATP